MTRLILVRHGQTDWNTEHRIQGGLDIPLNEVGRQQALSLAERLKNEKIDHIYSSHQSRAKETGEIIARYHPHTPFTVRWDLGEYNLGLLEGMIVSDVHAKYEQKNWDNEDFRRQVGAESYQTNIRHFQRYLPQLVAQHAGQTILISTHGGKKKGILKSIFPDGKTSRLLRKVHPTNCSLTIIEWEPPTAPRMVLYSDDSHLGGKRSNL